MIEQQAVWEKAHRKLKREVRRAHKRVSNQTDQIEVAPGNEEAAQWALDEADRIERKTFRKRRKRLRKLARKESIAFGHYTEAEAEQAESFAAYVLED